MKWQERKGGVRRAQVTWSPRRQTMWCHTQVTLACTSFFSLVSWRNGASVIGRIESRPSEQDIKFSWPLAKTWSFRYTKLRYVLSQSTAECRIPFPRHSFKPCVPHRAESRLVSSHHQPQHPSPPWTATAPSGRYCRGGPEGTKGPVNICETNL